MSSKSRVLITAPSVQDAPGRHHEVLAQSGFEIDRARGPFPESELLLMVGAYDGILCGEDVFTRPVFQKSHPRLRVLSKCGIVADKIDLMAAQELNVTVCHCPCANPHSVAEHAFGLLLSLTRQIPAQDAMIKRGEWKRASIRELAGKTLGILGLGRVGKEVARRAIAFDMKVCAQDATWDEAFAQEHGVERKAKLEDVLREADVLSLHMNLSEETRGLINAARLSIMKRGAFLINCARAALIHQGDVAQALRNGSLSGYGADVMDPQPVDRKNPLLEAPNVILTPHVASRTCEHVERQAAMAVENLVRALNGQPPLARAIPSL